MSATTTTSYGFGDGFEEELKAAQESVNSGEGKKRAEFKAMPGIKTTFAKAGTFNQDIPNPRDPKTSLKVSTSEMEGVILDASFNREYWITVVEEGKKKNKLQCQTVAHRRKADETEVESYTGNGKWQIPYSSQLTIEKYDPIGSRGKSCKDCIMAGEHGGAPGEWRVPNGAGCGPKGSLIVLQLGTDGGINPATGEPNGMVYHPEPRLANFQTPEVSGIIFQKYVTALGKEGIRPNGVKTLFQIEKTSNGQSHCLKLTKLEPVDANVLNKGQAAYKAAVDEIEAERTKRAEEYKKKQAAKNGGKTASEPAPQNLAVESDEFDL